MKKILRRIRNEIIWCYEFLSFAVSYFLHDVKKKRTIILVGTPKHGNIGDAAITIAERDLIREQCEDFRCIEVYDFVAGKHTKFLKRIIKSKDIIAINGGGFLGTLWIEEEKMCRSIIDNFHDNRIIIFPQSICYEESMMGINELKISRSIYGQHKNLTVCLREKYSYDYFKTNFPTVRTLLFPDMVLSLKNNKELGCEREGVLLCFREDRERILGDEGKKKVEKIIRTVLGQKTIHSTSTIHKGKINKYHRKKFVTQKLEEFSKAELIITDRLHGMIFAALTGTPCIAFNNISFKVGGVYAWISGLEYIYLCTDVEDMEGILKQINFQKKYIYNYEILQKQYQILANEIINGNK